MSPAWPTTEAVSLAPADRLVTLPDDIPPLTLGWHAIQWAESILIQPNGADAGRPFTFTPGQMRFLLHWYAVNPDGSWVYHHGVRRLAKGSGKSPFAAVLALIELCAPVRLHRIEDPQHPNELKRVTTKPVDMPWVQIAATAESQTTNTMRMVRAFAAKNSRLVREYGLDPGKTKYYKVPDGILEVITSSATTAEGAEASFVVGDETEHWRPSNGGPELAATLADNLAKSGSRMLETSNAWVPGVGSVAEDTWDAWVAQEEGRTRSDSKILYDARIAQPATDMSDRRSLYEVLGQVYADCPWVSLDAIVNRIWDPRSRPDDSQRKYLNRPATADDAWVDPALWSARAHPDYAIEDNDDVVLFFDGSKSKDATALVGCRVSDGHVFVVGVWERPTGQAGDGWQVPVDEVDAAVAYALDRWRVLAFYADVREWESYVYTNWPRAHGERLVLWAQKSGRNASPIAWDMRGHVQDFTLAAEAAYSDILEGQLTHDGSSVLARHVANAREAPNRWGISISKESRESARKVDAAVCMIGARMVRRHLLASTEYAEYQQQRTKQTTGRVVGWG